MKHLYFSIRFKTYLWNNIKRLGNLTFAINLLLFIACISIIGTIIEQNQGLQFYINTYSSNHQLSLFINWKVIKYLQLDHVYSSWWFLCLILTLSISLTICTISTQLPILQNAKRWKFYFSTAKILNLDYAITFSNPSLSSLIFVLNQKTYHVFQKNNQVYAYNGLVGRVAPIFVHFSIILLLVGSLLGLFGGVVIQEMITTGETIHPQNIIASGGLSYLAQKLMVHVEDFKIKYNFDNSIHQFVSKISIIDNMNRNTSSHILKVNTPIYFQNFTIYQTDWDIVGIRIQLENQFSLQIPCFAFTKQDKKYWISNLKINDKQTIYIIIKDLTGNLYIYNENGNFIKIVQVKQVVSVDNIEIYINNTLARTGLQIKIDPANWLVYFSFGILILSTIISYTSYSQLWAIHYQSIVYLGGKTNRAYLDFEKDIKVIKNNNIYINQKI